jgi:predicted transcriptional regulator
MANSNEVFTKEEKAIHVRRLRQGMGMTKVGWSQVSGIPLSTIEAYESGKRTPTTEYINMVSDHFDRDKELTRQIIAGVAAEIDRKYPHGILSEIEEVKE